MKTLSEFYSTVDKADLYGSKAGGRINPHGGVDLLVSGGEPIPALLAGSVYDYGSSTELGNWIIIHHDSLFTGYCHMERPSVLALGGYVAQGSQIGTCGATGNVTGPHVHFTASTSPVFGYGRPGVIDPLPVIQGVLNEQDKDMASAVLVRHHKNQTIALAADNGDFTPLRNTDEVNSLIAIGAVRPQIQLTDGLIWDKLVQIDQRKKESARG